MGVAVGDYDGDGFPDLYVTQYGRSILYRNNGDGTFTDVTEKAGVAAPGWASSAVWFDYDNDGKLDLFVCQFADFKSKNKLCGDRRVPAYATTASPSTSRRRASYFITTATARLPMSGKNRHRHGLGKGWGAVATDINNDGKMDLFVANDTVPNFLFVNRGKDKFEEIGFAAGVAYSADGRARSGMGVDSADFDNDGWMDLFVANIDEEIFALYRNQHDESFENVSMPAGIGMLTRWLTGWGLKFFDYDNDGDLDLILSNGFPDDLIDQTFDHCHMEGTAAALSIARERSYRNVSAQSGPVFSKRFAARGLAIGDFNNDGAVDVLVQQQ